MTNNICQCPDPDQDYRWVLATNENGWTHGRCGNLFAGEPAGYSPALDESFIGEKISSILLWFHEGDFIYISNGSEGDWITALVAQRCQKEQRYDQYSILLFILELQTPSHSEFWNKLGHSLRQGTDPRDRCACGALSTVSQGTNKWCSECHRKQRAGAPW